MCGDGFFQTSLVYTKKYFAMGFLLPFFLCFCLEITLPGKKTYPTVHGKFGSSHRLKSAKKVGGYVSRSQEGSLNFKS